MAARISSHLDRPERLLETLGGPLLQATVVLSESPQVLRHELWPSFLSPWVSVWDIPSCCCALADLWASPMTAAAVMVKVPEEPAEPSDHQAACQFLWVGC